MENESRAQGWRQKTESFRVPLVLWLRPRGLNRMLDTLSLVKGTWKEFWRHIAAEDDALVLVVCANYNHADWLKGGVESLMNQTFKRWRLMLVDDCSTDHSLDELKTLAQTDDRIQVIQLKENSGAYVARNTGVSASKEAWTHVTFFDPDDVAKKDWLEHVVRKLGKSSGVVRPILKRTDALLRGSKRLVLRVLRKFGVEGFVGVVGRFCQSPRGWRHGIFPPREASRRHCMASRFVTAPKSASCAGSMPGMHPIKASRTANGGWSNAPRTGWRPHPRRLEG